MKDRFKFNLTLFQVDDWANYLTTEKLGTAFVNWQYYTPHGNILRNVTAQSSTHSMTTNDNLKIKNPEFFSFSFYRKLKDCV